jgi:predicted nucleotidyltransferase component of viral defense system
MGEIPVLTRKQKIILAEVVKDKIFQKFYFTGGTALSAFHLQHRESEDLDFFSESKFELQPIFNFFQQLGKLHKFELTAEFLEVVYILRLKYKNNEVLKVDFGYYPYQRVEKGKVIDGLTIDSLIDIAINKLQTITQRTTVKDFVDLYYLLEKYTVWDLIDGVKVKFGQKLEPFILASDFLKVEEFDYLPKMIKPLTIEQLKDFFRKKAIEVGKQGVE